MKRWPQALLIGTFLPWCWLAMQILHELGHILAAWLTGGRVLRVVLHPLAISRTDVDPNPHPLLVVWGGPCLGILLPCVVWLALRGLQSQYLKSAAGLSQFLLGFCLLANGLYLGIGAFDGVGDAGDLLRLGANAWLLWLFGIICVPLGLVAWHGLGPTFGLGSNALPVTAGLALTSLALLLITVLLELSFSQRW